MSKHTPGPWHFNNMEILSDDSKYIAALFARRFHETEANARLIVASPDLLAALNRLLRAFESDYEQLPTLDMKTCWETNSRAIAVARAAIAKAEGATNAD